jgi:hypothetical protein
MVFRPGAFGLVCGNCSSVHAIANTSDNASDDELCGGIMALESSHLYDGTNDHSRSAYHDSFPSPERVTKNEHCYGSEQAANLVDLLGSRLKNVSVSSI